MIYEKSVILLSQFAWNLRGTLVEIEEFSALAPLIFIWENQDTEFLTSSCPDLSMDPHFALIYKQNFCLQAAVDNPLRNGVPKAVSLVIGISRFEMGCIR